jgi:hypothetical protein
MDSFLTYLVVVPMVPSPCNLPLGSGIHKKWVCKIVESVHAMAEYLPPDENPDVVKHVLGVS